MKRILSIVSLMLILFASTASAQFPGGFGGFGQQKPPKPISQDPNVHAPSAEISSYKNALRQVYSTLQYDFNSETCQLVIECFDRVEDVMLTIKVNYPDDFGAFSKFIKNLSKQAEKALNSATNENSRVRLDFGKDPNLRGSIQQKASENQEAKPRSVNLSPDAHFIVENEIAVWEVRFKERANMGWGGRPAPGAQNQPANSFLWNFRNLDEFKKLEACIDKSAINLLNKELIKQGKEMEANYGK